MTRRRTAVPRATDAFRQSPLSRAFRSLIRPVLKAAEGRIEALKFGRRMTGLANPAQEKAATRPLRKPTPVLGCSLQCWGSERSEAGPVGRRCVLRVREGRDKTPYGSKGRFFPHLPNKSLISHKSRTISSESRLINGLYGKSVQKFLWSSPPRARNAATGTLSPGHMAGRFVHGAILA
jgi:hypothetical protein